MTTYWNSQHATWQSATSSFQKENKIDCQVGTTDTSLPLAHMEGWQNQSIPFRLSFPNVDFRTQPRHGTLTSLSEHYLYTPHTDFTGKDYLTYSTTHTQQGVRIIFVTIYQDTGYLPLSFFQWKHFPTICNKEQPSWTSLPVSHSLEFPLQKHVL